jgi:hypothetical protein
MTLLASVQMILQMSGAVSILYATTAKVIVTPHHTLYVLRRAALFFRMLQIPSSYPSYPSYLHIISSWRKE